MVILNFDYTTRQRTWCVNKGGLGQNHLHRGQNHLHRSGAPIWPPEIHKKHLKFTCPIKALSFHSITSIRAHKHIF